MKILVGLSGGVDSAVSAYLLKQSGHEVHAGFMINYITEDDSCTTKIDLESARDVAKYLDIPFFTFDYREAYQKRIIDFIYSGYQKGLTPNPDVLCNNLVKFDLFAEEAREYGYDAIAMGHYARVRQDGAGFHLLKGSDPSKDQSYFLSRLNQQQLAYAQFPIGHLLKSEVRKIARDVGLPNAERKDSQGLCFIGNVSMRDFLGERLSQNPGDILDVSGSVIGKHPGAHLFTVGQRKGIEIGGGPALFVIAKDTRTNTITVGSEASLDLYSKSCIGLDWHSVGLESSISSDASKPTRCSAKIRYRQADQSCSAYLAEGNIREESGLDNGSELVVSFDESQRAVAPGQFIVLYDGEEVLGSAVLK